MNMQYRPTQSSALRSLLLKILGFSGLLIPLILYAIPHFTRPPRISQTRSLFPGAIYQRKALSVPRPLMLHIVTIDLKTPGLKVLVTPGTASPTAAIEAIPTEISARTTSEFLRDQRLQLAINANFFYPFREKTPWDFYPYSNDRTNVVGQAISNGVQYSPPEVGWGVICFLPDKRSQILASGQCPRQTQQAVAGSAVLVQQGQAIELTADAVNNDGLYSRTAVALDQSGEKLWLVAIDDKQPFYSEGVTLTELAELLVRLGVNSALNLDGGGSTTLAASLAMPTSPASALVNTRNIQVLNAPIHTKIPLRERPVANHLGFGWQQ